MSGKVFRRSRIPEERAVNLALDDAAVEVCMVESQQEHTVSGFAVGVDADTHERIGVTGKLRIGVPSETRKVLENNKQTLSLVLVAHSVHAAVSAVLVNKKFTELASLLNAGTEVLAFDARRNPCTDPLRASSTVYELYVTGLEGLPLWRKSWVVKLQEREGSWLMYALGEKEAEGFGIPKETYLYSDLENLYDGDYDLNNAKFYVNENVFARMHDLSRVEKSLLVRACLSDIIDHLAAQEAPEEGAHSMLGSIWAAYTNGESMDSDDKSRLTPASRRLLLGRIDKDLAIARLSVENLSSVYEEGTDE